MSPNSVALECIHKAFFKARALQLNGQAYEDFFSEILQRKNIGFRPVKTQGRKGDGGNDGFCCDDGTYYQVYAPERVVPTEAVSKIERDSKKIITTWHPALPMRRFLFVLNDRYQGAHVDVEMKLIEIKKQYQLIDSKPYLCIDLERDFMGLSISDRAMLAGYVPDNCTIENIKIPILADTIRYMLKNLQPLSPDNERLVAPKFENKIRFNNIPSKEADILRQADLQYDVVESYFNINPEEREVVRDIFANLYDSSMKTFLQEEDSYSKSRFWFIEKSVNFKGRKDIQDCIFSLMAYFFVSCDIFDEPPAEPVQMDLL